MGTACIAMLGWGVLAVVATTAALQSPVQRTQAAISPEVTKLECEPHHHIVFGERMHRATPQSSYAKEQICLYVAYILCLLIQNAEA